MYECNFTVLKKIFLKNIRKNILKPHYYGSERSSGKSLKLSFFFFLTENPIEKKIKEFNPFQKIFKNLNVKNIFKIPTKIFLRNLKTRIVL